MTLFFLDNCVPPPIGLVLRELDKDVRILQEEFQADAADTDWMPVVEKHDWIVLTVDNKIRRRDVEREMLKGSKLRMVFLPKPFGREQLWDQVIKILQWWPAIEKACEKLAPGTRLIMKTKNGKLHIDALERL